MEYNVQINVARPLTMDVTVQADSFEEAVKKAMDEMYEGRIWEGDDQIVGYWATREDSEEEIHGERVDFTSQGAEAFVDSRLATFEADEDGRFEMGNLENIAIDAMHKYMGGMSPDEHDTVNGIEALTWVGNVIDRVLAVDAVGIKRPTQNPPSLDDVHDALAKHTADFINYLNNELRG